VKCQTPCSLELAEGGYELAFENRGLSRPDSQTITVVSGRPLKVHKTMPGFTPDRALSNIFGASPQP